MRILNLVRNLADPRLPSFRLGTRGPTQNDKCLVRIYMCGYPPKVDASLSP
jgi:hypothetical protein